MTAIGGVAKAKCEACRISDSACQPAEWRIASASAAWPALSVAASRPLVLSAAQRLAAAAAGTKLAPGEPAAAGASVAQG